MRPAWVSAGCGLLLASCGFLLDFDELQAGDGADAGTDGAAAGGTGGGSCANGCDDGDPCTLDSCVGGICQNQAQPIVPDGFTITRTADAMHRVTLAGAADRFYMSIFSEDNGQTEVQLFSFLADGDTSTFTPGPTFSNLQVLGNRRPVSAAGLVVQAQGIAFDVHAYVALAPAVVGNAADIFHVVFDQDLNTDLMRSSQVSNQPNYGTGDVHRFPQAWIPGTNGDVWATWIGPGGEIYLHEAGTGRSSNAPVIAGPTPFVAPIGFGDVPGVVYRTNTPQAQLFGAPPTAFNECDAPPGAYLSASGSFTGVDGFWSVAWTKARPDYIGFEAVTIACGAGGRCTPNDILNQARCEERQVPLSRNPAIVAFQRAGDSPGRFFQVSALPFIEPDDGEAVLSLFPVQIDVNPSNLDQEPVVTPLFTEPGGLERDRTPTDEEIAGPDWPALAFAGNDRIALAWLRPADGGGGELRLERFRICVE